MLAEIIAVGSELLTPYRQDTNSLFITEQLNALGVSVAFKTIVGDCKAHLVDATSIALGRADIVFVMGGLGPTQDDLTREAVASALGVRLRRDGDLLAALYKRFAAKRATMPGNNSKQADVIEGAQVLPNPRGTAPGQWLDTVFGEHRKLIVLLPGPPAELKPMFTDECLPRLQEALPPRSIARRVLRNRHFHLEAARKCKRRMRGPHAFRNFAMHAIQNLPQPAPSSELHPNMTVA